MSEQTKEVSGSRPDASQNSKAAEASDNVTEGDRILQFLESAKAAPATEPEDNPEPPPVEPTGDEEEEEVAETEAADGDENSDEEADQEPDQEEAEEGDSPEQSEEDDVLSQFHPKAREKIQKRFDKLAAEKKAALDELTALKAQVAQLQQPNQQQPVPVPVDPNDPTSGVFDQAGLAKIAQDAQAALEFVTRHAPKAVRAMANDESAIEIEDGGKVYTFTIEQFQGIQRNALATLQQRVPQRAAWLQQRAAFQQQAQAKFPEFFDRAKPEHQQFEAVKRSFPQLASMPNSELLVGYALKGLKAEAAEAEAAKTKAKVEKAKKPPALAGESAAPAKVLDKKASGVIGLRKEIEAVTKRYRETGSEEDRIKLDLLQRRHRAASQNGSSHNL